MVGGGGAEVGGGGGKAPPLDGTGGGVGDGEDIGGGAGCLNSVLVGGEGGGLLATAGFVGIAGAAVVVVPLG